MARFGRKYAALFEVAALSGSENEPQPSADWASRVLRLMAASSWSDPSFLEELSESGLIRTMCRALPLLKANAASRASASCIQDLADLEEAFRKLRHELGLAEKRLPSHGVLGTGSTTLGYTTWASVGHVCTLMLQALTHSTAAGQAISGTTAATPRTSPTPPSEPSRAGLQTPPAVRGRGAAAGGVAASQPPDQADDAAERTPGSAAAAGSASGAAATAAETASGASTPRGAGSGRPLPGTPGVGGSAGSSIPAVATEGALLKLLGNKHVVVHAKDVLGVMPALYRAALARVLLSQISAEMQTTQVAISHILSILKGDPAATTPAPSSLPKAWFATASLLTAFGEVLKALDQDPLKGSDTALANDGCLATSPGGGSTAQAATTTAATSAGGASLSGSPSPLDSSPGSFRSNGSGSDVNGNGDSNGNAADGHATEESAEAPAAKAGTSGAGDTAASAADSPADGPTSARNGHTAARGGQAHGEDVDIAGISPPASAAAAAAAASAAPLTEPHGRSNGVANGAQSLSSDSDPSPSTPSRAAATSIVATAAVAAFSDPRVSLAGLIVDVSASLCDAVVGAHGVGRMALLLRGEVTAKYPACAAYMPAALSINELVAHLDALACVATALGAGERLKASVAGLLGSQAMKELLGAGKVYVTTVIAAGALTRDLDIDAVIPQSLRQGYMAAVLTPLETGALLNERRAPQVLAYRNSITESSYYQVMDADALPYGVNVRFEDEQEAEGMGVVREWLSQIAADIFSPDRGLFVRGAADRRVIHPAEQSRLQEDHLGYMRFAGRIVGLALRANVPLGVVLSTGLFNFLTGRRATLQDLHQIDPQVYTTCQNILATPGAEALELFFVWSSCSSGAQDLTAAASSGGTGAAGEGSSLLATGASHGGPGAAGAGAGAGRCPRQEVEVELGPGGSSRRVTDANKDEYVTLLAQHLVVTVVEEQCAAFLAGMQDTAHHLPDDSRLRRAFLAPLLPDDLNRITAGESGLDPAEWADHTDVAGFESAEDQQSLDMFWQLVSEYTAEDRQRLLQFWTAMTHLPSGGFKALNQRLQIMKLGPSADQLRLLQGTDAADGNAAAAAAAGGTNAATLGDHRTAVDSPGPHSHRLDGESLDAEEQEPAEGADEPAGSEGAGGERAGQPQAPALEGHPDAGPSGSGGGDSGSRAAAADADAATPAPASRHGADGRRGSVEGQENGPGESAFAPPPAPRAGGQPAPGQAAEGSSPGGGGTGEEGMPPVPYDDADVDEDELAAGAEEGMDYGDEELDDEEEFQRQLELALALSLQDVPSGAGADGGGGGGDGAGGSAEGTEPQPTGTSSAAPPAPGPDDQANGDAFASGSATERAGAGGEDAGSGSGSGGGGEAGGAGSGAVAAAAALETPRPQGPDLNAGSSKATTVDEAAGARTLSRAVGEVPSAQRDGPAAEAGGQRGSDASSGPGDGADGAAAVNLEAEDSSPLSRETPGTAAAAVAAADRTAANGPTAADRDGAHGLARGPEEVAVAGDATETEEAATTAGQFSGGTGGGGGDLPDASSLPVPAAESAAGTGGQTAAGSLPDPLRQAGPATDDPSDSQVPAATRHHPATPPPQPQSQPGQLVEASGQSSAAADDGPGAGESEGAAGRPAGFGAAASVGQPQVAAAPGRALLLLPQARTCFLQLNLPAYASLEDMRRAFAIALDNMSFGLH